MGWSASGIEKVTDINEIITLLMLAVISLRGVERLEDYQDVA